MRPIEFRPTPAMGETAKAQTMYANQRLRDIVQWLTIADKEVRMEFIGAIDYVLGEGGHMHG